LEDLDWNRLAHNDGFYNKLFWKIWIEIVWPI